MCTFRRILSARAACVDRVANLDAGIIFREHEAHLRSTLLAVFEDKTLVHDKLIVFKTQLFIQMCYFRAFRIKEVVDWSRQVT